MSLRDAIERDYYALDDITYTDEVLETMTIDELENLKIKINRSLSTVATSIREMRTEYEDTGKRDTVRYNKAKFAMSLHQRMLAYVNSIVRKRERQEKSDKSIGDSFMEVAKDILPKEEFNSILHDAQVIMQMRRSA